MKKTICALFALLALFALAGCGESEAVRMQNNPSNSVSSVIQQQMDKNDAEVKTETPQSIQPEISPAKKNGDVPSDVDVDLTKLSSTMVYSEVYSMLTVPEDYIGKTVRMSGQFALLQGTDANGQPVPDQLYFACVIADAAACCQQGLEFILAGDYKYPDDYPEPGAEITVSGEFQTYYEGQNMYCHLINAKLE